MNRDATLILNSTRSGVWPHDPGCYPSFCIEPDKGESHSIQNVTPPFGEDRIGWMATWTGMPSLI